MKLQELTLRFLRVPLIQPYVLSYRTYTAFEPIIVEAHGADGRIGWGEGHISPGSSSETLEGGWAFCRKHAAAIIGKDTIDAKAIIAAHQKDSKVAATALLTAIEMLDQYGIINDPALAPLHAAFHTSLMFAPGMRIAGGTDEILKNIIAERVLGLPGDIRVDKDVPFKDLPTGR